MKPRNESGASMRVLLFGSTGMVGQGVLLECLRDPKVTHITTIGRTPPPQTAAKLTHLTHADFLNYKDIEPQLTGFDACFFCLGTTTAGKNEAEYRRITHDMTLAAAATLARLNPQMTFVYLSGEGAGQGSAMWARVRGQTEQEVFALPFKAAFSFRPGVIQPLDQIHSKTGLYRFFYVAFSPLVSLARWLAPNSVATTQTIGRAMIAVAREGAPQRILHAREFEQLARARK